REPQPGSRGRRRRNSRLRDLHRLPSRALLFVSRGKGKNWAYVGVASVVAAVGPSRTGGILRAGVIDPGDRTDVSSLLPRFSGQIPRLAIASSTKQKNSRPTSVHSI